MKRPRLSLAPLLLFVLLIPSVSWAQNAAKAEALFHEGRAEMDTRRFDTGCPKIEESFNLDQQLGALFTLAECYALAGKNAKALARYDQYLRIFAKLPPEAQARQRARDRDKTSTTQKAALTLKVALVTLTLPPSAPPGTQVVQDTETLDNSSLGVERPLEPGTHVVTTQPPNGQVMETRFTVKAGERKQFELKVQSSMPETPVVVSRLTEEGSSTKPLEPRAPSPGMSKGYRGGMITAFGVGAAGLVLGAVTGGLVIRKKATIDSDCNKETNGSAECGPAGLDAAASAQSLAPLSTVGFAVGGAGVATGLLMLLLRPKGSSDKTAVGLLGAEVEKTSGTGATFIVNGAW